MRRINSLLNIPVFKLTHHESNQPLLFSFLLVHKPSCVSLMTSSFVNNPVLEFNFSGIQQSTILEPPSFLTASHSVTRENSAIYSCHFSLYPLSDISIQIQHVKLSSFPIFWCGLKDAGEKIVIYFCSVALDIFSQLKKGEYGKLIRHLVNACFLRSMQQCTSTKARCCSQSVKW